jgi:prevent-host-death family protein
MRTMSAKDAKNHFGELLLEAQKGPVTIEKNGRPTAVVLSFDDHEHNERVRLEHLRLLIREGLAELEAGRAEEFTDELLAELCSDGPTRFD